MNVLILDAGNSIIKAKTASREIALPHALKELSETDYQNILTRAGRIRSAPPVGYGSPTGGAMSKHKEIVA